MNKANCPLPPPNYNAAAFVGDKKKYFLVKKNSCCDMQARLRPKGDCTMQMITNTPSGMGANSLEEKKTADGWRMRQNHKAITKTQQYSKINIPT
jgi:hypothetical protein